MQEITRKTDRAEDATTMLFTNRPHIRMARVARAQAFAHARHSAQGQLRRYTQLPYIEHPTAVVRILTSVGHDEPMLLAAMLHDVVEDTPTTLVEIEREFGPEVAKLVDWLTDRSKPIDGNRATRKAIDRQRLAEAPAAAQTIKLADLIDNARSIIEHDPEFAKIYIPEKEALLGVLTKGDRELQVRAGLIVRDFRDRQANLFRA